MLRDELDLRRKTEIHEVEESKNGQISTLMQRHEEAFMDIKNYYNDITLNNLALINSLKVLVWSGRHAQGPWNAEQPPTPPDVTLLPVILVSVPLPLRSHSHVVCKQSVVWLDIIWAFPWLCCREE